MPIDKKLSTAELEDILDKVALAFSSLAQSRTKAANELRRSLKESWGELSDVLACRYAEAAHNDC